MASQHLACASVGVCARLTFVPKLLAGFLILRSQIRGPRSAPRNWLYHKSASCTPEKAEHCLGAVQDCSFIVMQPHCVRAFDATRRPAAETSKFDSGLRRNCRLTTSQPSCFVFSTAFTIISLQCNTIHCNAVTLCILICVSHASGRRGMFAEL